MGKCNVPTCRSQDPNDCDGCAGKDPIDLLKQYNVTIAISIKDSNSCSKICPYLLTGQLAKCRLFAETLGSATHPCRCRACVRFTMEAGKH
jgi:hypothetical protein